MQQYLGCPRITCPVHCAIRPRYSAIYFHAILRMTRGSDFMHTTQSNCDVNARFNVFWKYLHLTLIVPKDFARFRRPFWCHPVFDSQRNLEENSFFSPGPVYMGPVHEGLTCWLIDVWSFQLFKWKCCHFEDIFVIGCTESCQNNKVWCSKWRKFLSKWRRCFVIKYFPGRINKTWKDKL